MSEVLKTGYKKTKLGLIPENWVVIRLQNCLNSYRLGGNYNNNETFDGYPLVKMGNLSRGRINTNKVEYIESDAQTNPSDFLEFGDLLFNTRNTLDLVGKVAIWKNELDAALYNSNILRLEFDSKYVYSNFYMNYLFNSHYILTKLRKLATGSTSVAAIYTRDLLKLKIPLPPLPEQKKIAEILSTWDHAIETLEQLIAQKEELKRGLMQQLLTGKTRFPGFEGEWEEKTIGEIAKVVMGQSPESIFYNDEKNGIPLIQGNNDINNGKTVTEIYTTEVTKVCNAGDIILSVRAPVGEIGIATQRSCIGRGVCAIQADELISDYIFNFLRYFSYQWNNYSQGSTFKAINSNDIRNFKIKLPANKRELASINVAINDINQEINLLNEYKQQHESEKKGLMQQLLTGKTRVKVN